MGIFYYDRDRSRRGYYPIKNALWCSNCGMMQELGGRYLPGEITCSCGNSGHHVTRRLSRRGENFDLIATNSERVLQFRWAITTSKFKFKDVEGQPLPIVSFEEKTNLWEIRLDVDEGISLWCDGKERKPIRRNLLAALDKMSLTQFRHRCEALGVNPSHLVLASLSSHMLGNELVKNLEYHLGERGKKEREDIELLLAAGFPVESIPTLRRYSILKHMKDFEKGRLHTRMGITRQAMQLMIEHAQINHNNHYAASPLANLLNRAVDPLHGSHPVKLSDPTYVQNEITHIEFEREFPEYKKLRGTYGFDQLINEFDYDRRRLTIYLLEDIRDRQGITPPAAGITLLRDYNIAMRMLGLKPEKYPKSLKLAHDVAAIRYAQKKDQILEDNLKKKLEEAAQKEAKINKEFCIVAPKAAADFDLEHEALGHCIHTYKQRVAEGRSNIFFLRKAEEPEQPLVTVEVRKDEVVQARGAGNRSLQEKERKALEAWAKREKLQVSHV